MWHAESWFSDQRPNPAPCSGSMKSSTIREVLQHAFSWLFLPWALKPTHYIFMLHVFLHQPKRILKERPREKGSTVYCLDSQVCFVRCVPFQCLTCWADVLVQTVNLFEWWQWSPVTAWIDFLTSHRIGHSFSIRSQSYH